MGTAEITAFGTLAVTLIFGVIGYLLSHKDAAQAEQIKDLYSKIKENDDKLTSFRLDVAKLHYEKPEINEIIKDIKCDFEGLKSELHSGFNMLGIKIDAQTKALIDHITMEDKRNEAHRQERRQS